MNLGKVVSGLLVSFIGIMFILGFVPVLEAEIVTTEITNSFVATMLDMSVWIVPAVAVIGIILYVVRGIRNDGTD